MSIRVLEIHHHAVRIDSEPPKVEAVREFYADVLGLDADPGRPTIPGVPGFWINVSQGGQIHLIGSQQPSPLAKGPGQDPTISHVALAVADIQETKAEARSAEGAVLVHVRHQRPGRGADLHQRSERQYGRATPVGPMPVPDCESSLTSARF